MSRLTTEQLEELSSNPYAVHTDQKTVNAVIKELLILRQVVEAQGEALELANCDCSVADRMSGHKSDCSMPIINDIKSKVAAIRKEG